MRKGGGQGPQAALLAEARQPPPQPGRDHLRLSAQVILVMQCILGMPQPATTQHERRDQ